MEKTTLIFIGILLFSTCTPILAQTCKNNYDCFKMLCPLRGYPICVKGHCECPPHTYRALPDDTNC
ncbi:unnamed protein product, partial [Eruca vesicaria subsp. sativa]|nr:unnamed protein product [Eruca vesicaria subsp. sativa]